MGRAIDITGQTFGEWFVNHRAENRGKKSYYNCTCSCGTNKDVEASSLRRGKSTNCGCSNDKSKDIIGKRFGKWVAGKQEIVDSRSFYLCKCDCGTERLVEGKKLTTVVPGQRSRSCGCDTGRLIAEARTTHGMTNTSEYNIWRTIKQRTRNPEDNDFPEYGAKGINMCDEWFDSFETFFADMGPKPVEGYSVDRRNGFLGYSKENCYWATPTEQARNRASNRVIFVYGRHMTVIEASEISKIPYSTILYRLDAGWTPERAVTEPVRKMKNNVVKD